METSPGDDSLASLSAQFAQAQHKLFASRDLATVDEVLAIASRAVAVAGDQSAIWLCAVSAALLGRYDYTRDAQDPSGASTCPRPPRAPAARTSQSGRRHCRR